MTESVRQPQRSWLSAIAHRLWVFIVLFAIVPCGTIHAQSSITTATLIITNGASNGFAIQINGQYRYFTNVSSNAYNQITVDTNGPGGSATIAGTASNVYLAFIKYPQQSVNVSIPQYLTSNVWTTNGNFYTNFLYVPYTNEIQFQSYQGTALATLLVSNWATVSNFVYNTNTYIPVIVPTNGLGAHVSSNIFQGLVQWLNDTTYSSAAIVATNPIWSNFVNAVALAGLSNYVGLVATNSTNYANLIGLQATNYANFVFTNATNYANTNWLGWSNTVFLGLEYFTNALGVLSQYGSYHDVGNLTGNTNTILLTNEFGTLRMVAQADGGSGGPDNGYWDFYDSSGQHIWFQNGYGGDVTLSDYTTGTPRFGFHKAAENSGILFINGPNNTSTAAGADVALVNNLQIRSRPSFNQGNGAIPAVIAGVVTNFPPLSVTADATYNTFTFSGLDLTNSGDCVRRTIGIHMTTAGTYEFEIQFQGNDIINTGNVTCSGAASCSITCEITAAPSGVCYWNSYAIAGGATIANACSVGTFTLSTSATNTLVDIISFVGSGDVEVYSDNIFLSPSANYALLP